MAQYGRKDDPATDGSIIPELVFNGALVSEYLNSLLSSTTAMSMESGETTFIQTEVGGGWRAPGNPIGEAAIFFGTDLPKLESLRKENEYLKFKSELSALDVQVLRGENEIMKSELAGLKAKLEMMADSLEETDSLRTRVVEMQKMIDETPPLEAKIAEMQEAIDAAAPLKARLAEMEETFAASATLHDRIAELQTALDAALRENDALKTKLEQAEEKWLVESRFEETPQEKSEFIALGDSQPESGATVAEGITPETRGTQTAAPETGTETNESIDLTGTVKNIDVTATTSQPDPVAPDSEETDPIDAVDTGHIFISQPQAPKTNAAEEQEPEKPVSASTRVITDPPPLQKAKKYSKIIKQDLVKNAESAASEKVVKISARPPAQDARTVTAPESKPEPEQTPDILQQQQAPHLDIMPEDQPAADQPAPQDTLLQVDETRDIKVETVPAPKDVVRQNLKKYQELQKEAESKTPPEWHTIVR